MISNRDRISGIFSVRQELKIPDIDYLLRNSNNVIPTIGKWVSIFNDIINYTQLGVYMEFSPNDSSFWDLKSYIKNSEVYWTEDIGNEKYAVALPKPVATYLQAVIDITGETRINNI